MASAIARVSVSDLVRFWKWYNDTTDLQFDEMLERELLLMQSLVTRAPETRPQMLGHHVHAIVEDPDAHVRMVGDSVYYGSEDMGLITSEDLAAITEAIGDGLVEVPALKTYMGDEDTDVVVSMRIDRVRGFQIQDTKTVWSDPSPYMKTMKAETYEDSPQALFYADAFAATSVDYVLLYMGEQPPLITLRDVQRVTVDTLDLAHVHEQCQRVVSTFWAWCQIHGLDKHYLARFTNNSELEII